MFNLTLVTRHSKLTAGFTLIELLVVMAVLALILGVMAPRLEAFIETSEQRELRYLEQIFYKGVKQALKGTAGVSLRLLPPDRLELIDENRKVLAARELTTYRIEQVWIDGVTVAGRPEIAFGALGQTHPFALKLFHEKETLLWRADRLGGVESRPFDPSLLEQLSDIRIRTVDRND